LYNDNENTAKCKKCGTDVRVKRKHQLHDLEKHKKFKLKYEKQKFKAENVKSGVLKSIDSYIDKVGELSLAAIRNDSDVM
jgi:hypothetical protein